MSAADWTEDGIYRAAYLSLFDAEDREALLRVGRVLASQAISGDTVDEPMGVAHFRAAIEDARMLAEYLREISEKSEGSVIPTRAGRRLVREARRWYVSAADLVANLEAVYDRATGLAVDDEPGEDPGGEP